MEEDYVVRHHYDVIIVGGGIIGISTALEMKERGIEHVLVVDQGEGIPHPHAASTDISKVVRADYGSDELYIDMMVCLPSLPRTHLRPKLSLFGESGIKLGANKSTLKQESCL